MKSTSCNNPNKFIQALTEISKTMLIMSYIPNNMAIRANKINYFRWYEYAISSSLMIGIHYFISSNRHVIWNV